MYCECPSVRSLILVWLVGILQIRKSTNKYQFKWRVEKEITENQLL